MDKTYDPKSIESRWNHFWQTHHVDRLAPTGQPFCIMLPPPNVTGTLHMGHGFQQTLMDVLIRYHRMKGKRVLWQVGTDHAGIATQLLVEQQLRKQGIDKNSLGQEAFIEKVWEWKETHGHIIVQQMKRLGLAIDWSRERFSLDDAFSYATNEAFIRLFESGFIYKGKRLIHWDPVLKTAVSDLEITMHERQGELWFIQYPLVTGDTGPVVATTRPETLFADAALAVNPKDPRYQHLIGQMVHIPLTERQVPIVADDFVEQQFGTGCVKITPGHDFNDYALGTRHNLPIINIFTPSASLNENVPLPYQGLDRFEARKKVIAALTNLGLLIKTQPHALTIPHGERSGEIVEPMLTDQWFMKMEPLAKIAWSVVEQDQIRFIPKQWKKTYFQWLSNIQDWCLSRQLWWGHTLPVWYDLQKNIYVGHNEKDVKTRYQLPDSIDLKRETDVLDTWFSASLWPFATLGWPQQTPEYKSFYPTSVLITGFDILFFWVARMIMMGLHITKHIPFHVVYLTGLVRDSQGKKMSKSKGNTLDPIDIIDGIALPDLISKRTSALLKPGMAKTIEAATRKEFPNGICAYGADALRFAFSALASGTRYINFDLHRIEGYRNFCNKLWNAARFVFLNTQEFDAHLQRPLDYSLPDRWIRHRLQAIIKRAEQNIEQFRFDLLAQELYEFIWNDYCDWYLELAKSTLHNPQANAAQLRGTQLTLLEVLDTALRLLHPIIPFITEEIWQTIAMRLSYPEKTMTQLSFPIAQDNLIDMFADTEITWLRTWINAIRSLRNELHLSPAVLVSIIVRGQDVTHIQRTNTYASYLKTLAKVSDITWVSPSTVLPPTVTILIPQVEIHIALAGLVNKEQELKRLDKMIQLQERDLEKINRSLTNQQFLNKAPAEHVNNEKKRFLEIESALKKLKNHRETIQKL